MRVAVNTLTVVPGKTGGGETYLVNLLRAMLSVDDELRLALLSNDDNAECFRSLGDRAELVRLRASNRVPPLRVLYEHLALPRVVRRLGVDVLLSPGNAPLTRCPVPQVVVIQSLLFHFAPEQTGRLRRAYFRHMTAAAGRVAERMLAVSNDIADELVRLGFASESKIRVVHEGVHSNFASAPPDEVAETLRRLAVEPPYVLYVGTVQRYKNVDKIVAPLRILAARGFGEVKLVIVGRDADGNMARIQRLAGELGVRDRVHYVGVVSQGRLPPLYTGAAALVLLSSVESFGLPLLEAMACGTPVVAANLSALPEIVGDAGLLVDPEDPDAVADAIERVIKDTKTRERLVSRGFERVRRFTWERAARGTLDVLREAVHNRGQE